VSEPADRHDSDQPRRANEFGVVVVTSRPTVHAFFAEIARLHEASATIALLPLDARAVSAASDGLTAASVAVVDASVECAEAVAVCVAIRAVRPRLPITAVFCCPHAATAADLRGLLAAGVEGLLDLQLSAADTLRVLRGVARGQGAFHLQLAAGSSTSLVELLVNERAGADLSDHDVGLLRLVAAGLTDHEIGRQLYLSHHTVKHRIDRLRRRVRARNRIQLAAWAGSQEALRIDRGGAHNAAYPPADEIPVER
jgi:DNA-binding NarL/FixJ family response regulator